MCVCFQYTLTFRDPSSFLVTRASRNGSLLSDSCSTVKLMEGEMEFRWLRTASTDDFCKKENISSTYLLQNLIGDGDVAIAVSSTYSMKMLATTGETGEPMAVPSVCS